MKTNGKTWNEYLNSWPDGQYFDDSNEKINGIDGTSEECPNPIPDDAMVEFSEGVIFRNNDDQDGIDLVRHFSKWMKAQTSENILITVPKDKAAQFKAALKSYGAKVSS